MEDPEAKSSPTLANNDKRRIDLLKQPEKGGESREDFIKTFRGCLEQKYT